MVDFTKLIGKQSKIDTSDPLKLFESLDRKGSHTTLRPAQIEALSALHQRRSERDHVLKLGTGVGKSSVALLYLYSHMSTSKRPGVYLCPTRQLVLQALDEARRLGIQAFEYPSNQRHPDPACMAGEAIIICTYAKLFNGLTTFDRADVNITPSAIVLDDAHTGVDEIRQAFTIHLTDATVRASLMSTLDGVARAYHAEIWDEILQGRRDRTLELPYWAWSSMLEEVRSVLSANSDHEQIVFAWPFIHDQLRWCRCVIAMDGIEIAPTVLSPQLVRAYNSAAHRLYMSGTLADEAVLVRELNCSAEAALSPILAGADAGLGERMVLAPTLIDTSLGRSWVMELCKQASQFVRVVVLCSSERQARDWEPHGATVVKGDAVIDVVEQLRSGNVKFAALAQRYDGVDLPDEACRILVLDGMPYGESIIDRHDSAHSTARNRLIFRIEQGMGRAVRSPADYAVVILSGPELASFTSKIEVRELMGSDARLQIELAHELAKLASSDPVTNVFDMVRKSINRDLGWKGFYDEKVRSHVVSTARRAPESAIHLAQAEQKAATRARDGATAEAVQTISEAIAKHIPSSAEQQKGQFIQQKANYQHSTNPGEALETQKHAHAKNRMLFRPPAGVIARPASPERIHAAGAVLRWYSGFVHPNGAIAEFQAVRAKLSFSVTHNIFEQGLMELAVFVGSDGSRPELDYGVGAPDNLWLWGERAFVIEAKNEAIYNEIPKKDAEQLLHSMKWFESEYSTRVGVPVMAAKATRRGNGVFMPDGSRILTPLLLEQLANAVAAFLAALTARSSNGWSEKEITNLLEQHKLTPDFIISTFTLPVE